MPSANVTFPPVIPHIIKVYKFVKNEQPEKTETTPIVE